VALGAGCGSIADTTRLGGDAGAADAGIIPVEPVADGGVLASDADVSAPDASDAPASVDAGVDAGTTPPPPDAGTPDAPGNGDLDPTAPSAIHLTGGNAPTANGRGAAGGTVHLIALGALSIDPALSAPAPPTVVGPPADALAVTTSMLGADVSAAGAVSIDGTVTSGGADLVREIAAGGDLFVLGTLRAADVGAGRQGLTLRAGGTVYIGASGVVDASGAAGSGQAGGAVTIVAQRVVIAGKLATAGGGGTPGGGAAGAIGVTATDGISLSGRVVATGGWGTGAAPVGGQGGAVTLRAGGDVLVGGQVWSHGGVAGGTGGDARGGAAGGVTIDCGGAATLAGTVDGRGGLATAVGTGGGVAGGAAGSVRIGESARPTRIDVLVPIALAGGEGAAAGGAGGTAHLEPHAGNLRLAGLVDASGGDSAVAPGAGGIIDGNPGPDTGGAVSAGVDIAGLVVANGGSIVAGHAGDGADGGIIKLVVLSTVGNMTVAPGGMVQADGGKSGGAGRAGGGGLLYLFTRDGAASMGGTLQARGGAAPDAGGTGGAGGFVYIFTDDNHGGEDGGALVIETSGLIDVSGGPGTIGGSARSDGRASSVALWPVTQDDEYDVQQTAVLINSDGRHGVATGWIDNRGHILARGGSQDGSGGDVQYHGRTQDGNETPLPGDVDMSGAGTGAAGDYAGE
jgi:hypothetical protein